MIESNYRPISVLHFLSHIFEKSISKRFISFADAMSLFSSRKPVWFPFSNVNSDSKLGEFIYDSLNGKSYTLCVFVDLSKAFDTVNHEILPHKLFLYGIGVKLFSLIERIQCREVGWIRVF